MSAVSTASANKKFHIAKFGGTSVANYETMYKSTDIVIANKNVRIVVLSASSGITNLLIKLTEACNDNRRKALLKQIRQRQYTIINCLDNPLSIQPIIYHLLARLTSLSAVTTQQPLTAPQIDEIVSYGELMSSYLFFVEILLQRGVIAIWFDVHNIIKTNDKFGKTKPNQQQLKRLANKISTT